MFFGRDIKCPLSDIKDDTLLLELHKREQVWVMLIWMKLVHLVWESVEHSQSITNTQQQQQHSITLFHMQILALWCRLASLFFLSPSLVMPLCAPLNSHRTHSLSVSLARIHTHTLSLPWGCVWLRHEINFWACPSHRPCTGAHFLSPWSEAVAVVPGWE